MTRESGMLLSRDIRALRADVSAQQAALAELREREAEHARTGLKKTEELSAALQAQGSVARTTDADFGAQMERMIGDLQELRGAVEVNEHRIGESETKIQASLGERLDQLSRQVAEARERPATAAAAEVKLPRTPARALAAGLAMLRAGQGPAGRSMLRALGKKWPGAAGVSDEALYRLGDSLALEVGCEPALKELIAVVERFPKSAWVDDAYYRIGVCSQTLGRPQDAAAFLGELVARFPKSPWVGDARARLAALAAGRGGRDAAPAADPGPKASNGPPPPSPEAAPPGAPPAPARRAP